uniref:Lipoprotein n=1 Tax=Streptomyces sp. NBC_00049 TaxID=2903617 RepID=A0AAU2JSA3_9ACTN
MDSSSNQRRMRSGAVALGGMGLLAVTLVACGSSDEPDRRCASRSTLDHLNNKDCKSSSGHGAYYYGGTVKNGKVTGGSFDKSAVTRGGIGGSHSGSSGG